MRNFAHKISLGRVNERAVDMLMFGLNFEICLQRIGQTDRNIQI